MMSTDNELSWWQTAIVYQIYPRSFQDSNGDGIGDLKGIQSRLDHFEYLGVEAIWLSPIYESPMADFGYDISNFIGIDPMFGTMSDFDDLIADIHKRGMKLIMDYVPNHSSDRHPWFIASKKSEDLYKDYYVWNEGKLLEDGTRVPPNNWVSIFGGPAWEWVEERKAYYYHAFLKEQPDLNYNNPNVRREMEDVFRFWLAKGVDGFRIDAISTLFENNYDKDEELIPGMPPDEDTSYVHTNTRHQPQIHEVVQDWRKIFDAYEQKTGKYIFMVMEVYDDTLKESMKYYHTGADLPFNFNLMRMTSKCGGYSIFHMVNEWMEKMPSDKWPNFVLGNHDRPRITTQKGLLYADALNLLLLTLPGTPTTYQGEEIAMTEIKISFEDTIDPAGKNFGPEKYEKFSRDPCRIPMQWNGETNAGFSTAEKTWLPVNPDYITRNVEIQKNPKSGRSSLLMYREVAKLRRQPAFQNNRMKHAIVSDEIFSYIRSDGNTSYLIAINVGSRVSTRDYYKHTSGHKTGVVEVVTPESDTYKKGDKAWLKAVKLAPGDGIAIRLI